MAIDYSRLAIPKGERRQTARRRAKRQEAAVIKAVRAQCVTRDGYCRHRRAAWGDDHAIVGDQAPTTLEAYLPCEGPSEWAHLPAKRRSKTRGMAPEARHDTAHTLMLCRQHHDQLDGRQRPRLFITALTRQGANGPLRFRRGKA